MLPRVAAKLDVAMLSEITGVLAEDTFTRNIYAGVCVCVCVCVRVCQRHYIARTPPLARSRTCQAMP